jgi:shikimate dehydrogenase
VLWGLLRSGVAAVTLAVRTPEKGEALAEEFKSRTEADISVCAFGSEAFRKAEAEADILVNTTPLGMTPKVEEAPPVDWDSVKVSAFVYDIIYTPAETRFLREAREHGCAIQNVEAMLAGQGAAALALWTGIEPDAACMCRALREELSKR